MVMTDAASFLLVEVFSCLRLFRPRLLNLSARELPTKLHNNLTDAEPIYTSDSEGSLWR